MTKPKVRTVLVHLSGSFLVRGSESPNCGWYTRLVRWSRYKDYITCECDPAGVCEFVSCDSACDTMKVHRPHG